MMIGVDHVLPSSLCPERSISSEASTTGDCLGTFDMHEGADGAVVTDGDIAVDDCEWSDDSIAADRDTKIHMSLRGVFDRDSGQHQLHLDLFLDTGGNFRHRAGSCGTALVCFAVGCFADNVTSGTSINGKRGRLAFRIPADDPPVCHQSKNN